MNLFVLAWNASQADRTRAGAVLRAMDETFPSLDRATIGEASSTHAFATWMHHADPVARPRRYVHRSDGVLVMYDGTIAAPDGQTAAHDAEVLARQWSDLPERLEGTFVGVRLDTSGDTLEIVNDAMGTHTTYACRKDGTWWIANSVRLLAACAGTATLDLTAVAEFVAMGTPTDHRTLVEGVSKLPAAQRWRWTVEAGLQQRAYWSFAELAAQPKARFDERSAERLAAEMTAPLRVLADHFPPLQCPITGGRDSRMLAGLTMAGNLPTEYFSYGPENDVDVQHATRIAEHFGLNYQRRERSPEALLAAWDEASLRTLRKNDGLVTLMHAQNAVDVPDHVDHLPVMLYGGGGERARSKRLRTTFLLTPSIDRAIDIAHHTRLSGLPFVREDARGPVRDEMAATIRRLADLGFAAVDLLDAQAFDMHETRWVATEGRQRADHKDVITPFLSRAYMGAAFGTPATERAVERIPYLLLEHLSPELRRLPTSSPWPPRSVVATLLQTYVDKARKKLTRAAGRSPHSTTAPVVRTQERVDVLGSVLPSWRERFLDRTDSPVWRVLDRQRFENLTSPDALASERTSSLTQLYKVGTALAFEDDFADWMERWRPAG